MLNLKAVVFGIRRQFRIPSGSREMVLETVVVGAGGRGGDGAGAMAMEEVEGDNGAVAVSRSQGQL